MKIPVDIKLTRGARMPQYSTPGSAAADLCAALEGGTITIAPGEWVRVPTGVAISAGRSDIVAIVASRSGLGAKHGISMINGIGVIDSDYRGEISVTLANHSNTPYVIEDGDRIGQIMFMPILAAEFFEKDELDTTERGEGGFGSTGK